MLSPYFIFSRPLEVTPCNPTVIASSNGSVSKYFSPFIVVIDCSLIVLGLAAPEFICIPCINS